MKLAAIICEYNPLHNGHKYQIEKTKEITGCDYLICVMSGNFTQRAEASIIDKYTRAEIAIYEGADIVVNIPTAYSVNNAEIFANAAIKVLNSFKNINYLSFGMEDNNIDVLEESADFFLNENKLYKKYLKKGLNEGKSFNDSRVNSVKKMLEAKAINTSNEKDFLKTITMPNNILALEYIKALKKTKSKIRPVAIKRLGSNYNDVKLGQKFSSATAIRNHIYNDDILELDKHLPKHSTKKTMDFLNNYGIVDQNKLLKFQLINFVNMSKKEIRNIYNVKEGIENRIKTQSEKNFSPTIFKEKVLTKRFKESRINSIFLNSILKIDKKTIKKIYKSSKLPFIKVLAVNKNSNILGSIKCNTNLIIRKKDALGIKKTMYSKKLIDIENLSNNYYNHLHNQMILQSNDIYIPARFIDIK